MAARIFINYRRDDTTATAGRLHDRLAQSFGRKNLFMDVDHIPAGVDFVDHLNDQVAACDVFLALIGPKWLEVRNEKGDRRLHDADDFVAIEIASALARNIRVIPVLIDGARLPKASELPESLKPLVRRHAVELRHSQFGRDVEALIAEVGDAFEQGGLRRGPWRLGALSGVAAIAALLVALTGAYWSPDRSPPAYIVSPSPVESSSQAATSSRAANAANMEARTIRSEPLGLGAQAGETGTGMVQKVGFLGGGLPNLGIGLLDRGGPDHDDPEFDRLRREADAKTEAISQKLANGADYETVRVDMQSLSKMQQDMSAVLDRQDDLARAAIRQIKGQ